MAATNSTPVVCYVATIQANTALNQSSNCTATYDFRSGYEFNVPILIGMSTASADPQIDAYRSSDGTATGWDSVPTRTWTLPRLNSAVGVVRYTVTLPRGLWALKVTTSGPNTQTVAFLTAEVVTALMAQ